VAAWLVSSREVGHLIDRARAIDHRRGLQLVPAPFFLTVVFLVLLPDTPLAGAHRVAEMLRRAVEEHPVLWNEQTVVVTASFGLTEIVPGEIDTPAIIGRADAGLYQARQDGRNCVREQGQSAVNRRPPA
jgi:predicted signal transduction protein with EAL and GGDEF domain